MIRWFSHGMGCVGQRPGARGRSWHCVPVRHLLATRHELAEGSGRDRAATRVTRAEIQQRFCRNVRPGERMLVAAVLRPRKDCRDFYILSDEPTREVLVADVSGTDPPRWRSVVESTFRALARQQLALSDRRPALHRIPRGLASLPYVHYRCAFDLRLTHSCQHAGHPPGMPPRAHTHAYLDEMSASGLLSSARRSGS